MTIDEFRYFVYVANTENINSAAKLLNISESALSKAIRRIESEIGYNLFNRDVNKLTLNKNGQVFYEASLNILKQWQAVLDINRTDKKGIVNVYATDLSLLQNLAEYIVYYDFNNEYSVEEHLSSTKQIINAFNHGLCDFAVTLEPLSLDCKHLQETYKESLVLVAKKGFLIHNHPTYLKDFQLSGLLTMGKTHPLIQKIYKYKKTHNLKFTILPQIDSAIYLTKLALSDTPGIMTKTASNKINKEKYDVIELDDYDLCFDVYITTLNKYKSFLHYQVK